MKRIVLVITIFCILLTSCQSSDASNERDGVFFDTDVYNGSYDSDPNFMIPGTQFCETDDAYYGIVLDDTYYKIESYDKASGQRGYLCGNSNCKHNDETCDAIIFPTISGISVYDDRIYWAEQSRIDDSMINIVSKNLDGTDYKICRTLSREKLDALVRDFCIKVHRGDMYFSGVSYKVTDESVSNTVIVTAESLFDDESITVIENDYGNLYPTVNVQMIGNNMYIVISTTDISDASSYKYTLEVYLWNKPTQKLKRLYKGDSPVTVWHSWIVPEVGVYFSGINHKLNDVPTNVYKLDFSNKKIQFLFDYSELSEEYAFPFFADNMVVASTPDANWCCVKDFEGNLIMNKELRNVEDYVLEKEQRIGRTFLGADENCIYFSYCENKYYAAFPLDDKKGEILWGQK